MKCVINGSYGGYKVPQEIADKLGCWCYDDTDEVRTNPIFVKWVEENKGNTSLVVVDIPEEATDWVINEYDGLENVLAVINGKIVFLDKEDDDE